MRTLHTTNTAAVAVVNPVVASAARSLRQERPKAFGMYHPAFEQENCGTGFIVDVQRRESRRMVVDALEMLVRMEHRSARGADAQTGDGVGILTSLPHEFFSREFSKVNRSLPKPGSYAAGIVFLPHVETRRAAYKKTLEAHLAKQKLKLLWWRPVPTDASLIGEGARACEPHMEQLFIENAGSAKDFELRCYAARKAATAEIENRSGEESALFDKSSKERMFYICSLSSQTIIYKGMLTTDQLEKYYLDLQSEDFAAYLALVHSRFSTNTFPSWDRAQPCRMMAHNGEINTWYGNVNKMRAREGVMKSDVFKKDLASLYPVIEKDVSDSGAFDNALEFLYQSGYSLPEVLSMMIPEAWQHDEHMDAARRDMYRAYSCVMEPWDGPACITFTDGRFVGAVIDRNGLRPSRYYTTDDGRVILASEFGVLDIDPARVVKKDRLQPGRMFLIDTKEGRIIEDEEIKARIAAAEPYGTWMREKSEHLSALKHDARIAAAKGKAKRAPPNNQNNNTASAPNVHGHTQGHTQVRLAPEDLARRALAYGYTEEDKMFIIKPMVEQSKEPIGSMGNDVALACLSEYPRLLYDYFKQWFAQVTNPPIDSIRERVIMSCGSFIGPEENMLKRSSAQCRRLWIDHPVLDHEEFALLKEKRSGWSSATVDITYAAADGEKGLDAAITRICEETARHAAAGRSCVILSDRGMNKERMPVSALLALASAHHHLIRTSLRSKTALIVESGEMREVHHFCMLIGYGADALFPYVALETALAMRDAGIIKHMSDEDLIAHYKKAADYGICKVLAKMGISTVDSYRGAQIFEAVGIGKEVIDRCFANTLSRIGGIGLAEIHKETALFHERSFAQSTNLIGGSVISAGNFQWRKDALTHMWDPQSIALLQHAVRYNDEKKFKEFVSIQNRRSSDQATIRGLLRFKNAQPIPLEEVESAADIVKRFASGAMSFGSISQEAHETLAIAMNRMGAKSNTGEGGELAERYVPLANGDSKRSAIKQVASGRFGVTIEYLTNANEIQIKMAQGAKPGEGGELPGHKVFDIIAKTRHSTPGIGLISPPPHHDIYSIEDLAQLIFDLKNANPSARISVKLVSKAGVGVIAAGVAKGKADHILISGHDGGTGASPLTSIKHAGLPWEMGIAETHQVLVANALRDRVVLQTDGQLKTGRDVVIAAMLGAEEFGFATSALISMGCIMMRKCELNTCPVGIATQDEKLRAKFTGTPEHVVRFMMFVAENVREEMAKLGFRTIREMVGRSDMLEKDPTVLNWKSKTLHIESVLGEGIADIGSLNQCCGISQDHGIEDVLDRAFIRDAADVLRAESAEAAPLMEKRYTLANTNRSTGTMLSHEIAKRFGLAGLADDTIRINVEGHAGQSFGAFLSRGVTLSLIGDANDYVGKGLSGGVISIAPPKGGFVPEENIILGNVALYGAVTGRAFFRGRAGERFCIRNSGAKVVVEGAGAHCCEYMTGGRVVILGGVGINFAAGMSGGIAYVLDDLYAVREKITGALECGQIDDYDAEDIVQLLSEHARRTGSTRATEVLADWDAVREKFVKVIASEYRRVLEVQRGIAAKKTA